MELVILLAVTASVIGLVGRIPDPRRVKHLLGSARIQTINSLVDGASGAVRGTVNLTDASTFVASPLTHRQCAYYLIVIDEVGVGGDFHELGRIEAGVPFLLRSDDGTARVVPDRPRLAIPTEVISRPVSQPDVLGPLMRGACKKPNYSTSWVRATEYALMADTFVTVSGWCTREPDPEAAERVSGYREHLPTRPVISGSRRAKLLIG